jgi:hypothetical protein
MFDMPDIHRANGQMGISAPDARRSVAAQTIPGTLAATGRVPMASAPSQVTVRSGSTALTMMGVPSSSAPKGAASARAAALA